MHKLSKIVPSVHNGTPSDKQMNSENQSELNNGRSRTMSSSSFYSIKSWKSIATGDMDFYSICSADSFKST